MSLIQSTPLTQLSSKIINADYCSILCPDLTASRPQPEIVEPIVQKDIVKFLIEPELGKVWNAARNKYTPKITDIPQIVSDEVLE